MGTCLIKYSHHHALLKSNIHRNSCDNQQQWSAKDTSFQKQRKDLVAPSFSILSQRKSPSSLAQPITYAVPLSLPGAGQGRSSHHNENLVKSLALFVLALREWFGAVDKIAIVADIVNHTKELLTATSLQVGKTFIYGYMNTKSKAYGLYSFARMKYLTCLENYFS